MGAVAMLVALLPACTVGPDYHRPETPMPAEWGEAPGATPVETVEAAPAEHALPSVAEPTAPPEDWWTALSDPTLNTLVERAWRGNLDVSMAQWRILQSRAYRRAAAGRFYPEVEAQGGYDQYRADGPLFPVNTGEYDLFIAGLDASWEIDIFGGVRRSVEAAQADVEAQIDAKRAVLVSVICEVARNYVELRTAQRRVHVAKENIQNQTSSLELAQRLSAAGIVSNLDVTRAHAELTQTQSQVPALEIQEKAAVHQLGILLGERPMALAEELADAGPVPTPVSRVPIGLPSELLKRRPDVRQVERELAAATARMAPSTESSLSDGPGG